ncbi:MAG: GNAT family N-acetyltransferase [Phycisphaerae bacterium]|nr:GNAT family N-acetyltransferase [Phycisphaerae bacterium]
MYVEGVQIAKLDRHPEFVEPAVDWMISEWGNASREVAAESLEPNAERPSALVAISPQGLVGVLSYRMYLLAKRGSMELWVNALYVVAPWRGRGVGTCLLREGMRTAADSGRSRLYVYTDIPGFYEKVGWERFSYNRETAMYVLELSLA